MSVSALPDFVVAGAARAGSTAVVESLRRRPDVFITQPKEPHYLALGDVGPVFTGPGDDTTINRVIVSDRRDYEQLFAGAPEGALTGEGSVSTLYHYETAARRLLELNPGARVVIVLREPVSRAYSSHQYLVNRGFEPVVDFREAVALEGDRIAQGWHHLWHYTAMSRYADAVDHFLRALPDGAVRTWWHDDLIAHEERTLAEMHTFLGLPPAAAELSAGRVNASGTPRRPWLQSGMQVAARSATLRRAVKSVVPFELRERIRASNLAATDVPKDVYREMSGLFGDDLARLEQVLGRSVPSGWLR